MATPTKYTKSVSSDFAGPVIISSLKTEIQAHASIYHSVDFLAVSGDVLEVWFKDSLDAVEVVALDVVIATHTGTKEESLPRVEIANHVKAEAVPTQGSRTNFVTHNFTDKTTWYSDSVLVSEEALTDYGDGLTWICIHKPVVDVSHGRIFGEHDLSSYRLQCSVDGVDVAEKDKHTGAGDFVFDYTSGSLVFDEARTGQVKLSYYKVQSSRFTIKATAGKKLTISEVETQFSADYDIRDGLVFQPKALVELVAPHLAASNGGPVPDGTLIDIASPTIYNTDRDFMRESNGAFPVMPASVHADSPSNWRMANEATLGYPWKYKAGIELSSSIGAQIDIHLEHDEPFGGAEATATLYCLSEDEE